MKLQALELGAAAHAGFATTQPAAEVKQLHPESRGAKVVVERLSNGYGGHPVLQDVSPRLAPGEFVAIVGRSGCGKRTLLRHVAGLEQAESGLLHVVGGGGGDGTHILFQEARLLPWKNVLDNVALGLHQRALEWPAVLSGGQRQRVALARALVHEPRLLLDEPLGAPDALTRIELQQLIESLWREHGFTALLVTHDVSEAVAPADRVVLIEDHRIAFDERVPLPRPRPRTDPGFAAFEARVLERLLKPSATPQPADDEPGSPTAASGLRWALRALGKDW